MPLKRRSTEQDELLGGGSPMQPNPPMPPPQPRRRRGPVVLPGKLLVFVGVLCLLPLLLAAALMVLIDGERLRPGLEASLTAAIGRKVEIRKLSFSLRRFALSATGLTVAEDPKFGEQAPFLQVPEARFHLRLASLLFSRDPQVTGVTLDSPVLVLRQDAAGAWNYYSLLRTANPTGQAPLSVEVAGGRVSITFYGDESHAVRLRNVRFRSPALSLQANNPFALEANVEGGGTLKVDGRAGPVLWDTSGLLVPFSGLLHAVGVNLAPSNIVSSSPAVAGELSVDASIESDGRKLRIDGQASAAKLQLAAAGAPAAEPLQASCAVMHDLNAHAGVLSRCEFRVDKGTAVLSGRYISSGRSPLLNLDLIVSDAPVTNLAPFLPALGFPLPVSAAIVNGTIVGKIKLDGPLEGPVLDGSLSIDGARVTGFDLSRRLAPIEGLNASDLNEQFEVVSWKTDLKTGGSGLNLENLRVAIAGLGSLAGSGAIAPDTRLDFHMTGIRGLTGPKGATIPFQIRGTSADPVLQPR